MIDNDNLKIKELVNNVFKEICASKSISGLEKILDKRRVENKYRIKIDDYPKIEFNITIEEIQKLEEESFICKNIFNHNKIGETENTIVKLLYAMAWKNGDLKKIRHIIQGIKNVGESSSEKNDGLVFYQFGKYLTKKEGQPIIDQHVLRAFKVYRTDLNNICDIKKSRNLTTIGKNEKALIIDYKNWLISEAISDELKKETDYAYHIDKILYAVGKKIKFKNNEK
ncbi:hypothetical protein GCM10022389_02640 [Flavobacterium cheonanense]|uniref:Uncharacterized protein n=1 Tax=Flavobacterium cheonanense TaxID=706183 RepID=A0ABP7V8Z8_9FLAO